MKSDKEAESAVFQDAFECQMHGAENLGKTLFLLTEKEIKKQPLLKNLKLLHKYRTNTPLTRQHHQILELLSGGKELSIHDLCIHSGLEKKKCYPMIYDLMARCKLESVNSIEEKPLNSNTAVRVK